MVGTGTYPSTRRARPAFSLVELVMVVTIIGIIAAIAVPRMSNATTRASANALQATLTNVRKAIDCYYAEHSKYPGYNPSSGLPDGDDFINQLLKYSDLKGRTQPTHGYPYIYGPYLRAPFPRNPTNDLTDVHVKATPGEADPIDGSVGWVAVLSHGYFGISASGVDLVQIGIDKVEHQDALRGMTN